MYVQMSGEDFEITGLQWPAGAPAGLPQGAVVFVPYHIRDDDDDSVMEEHITETIFEMVGVRPLDTFECSPRDEEDDGDG